MAPWQKRITAGVPGVRASGQSVWVNQPSTATLIDGDDFDAWEQAIYDVKRQVVNVKADYELAGDNVTDDTAGIQAAIDDVMAGTVPRILHFPYGQYKVTSTIDLTGSQPIALLGSTSPDSSSSFFRHFDGPLLSVRTSLLMRDMQLWDTSESTSRAGAAIQMIATASDRAQYCLFDHIRICSSVAGAGAWERLIDADGTLISSGIRDIQWRGCYFFGARIAGETIRVNAGTNWFFHTCHMSTAPVTSGSGVRGGITISGAGSDTFLFSNCDWGADIVSSAAATYFDGKMIFTNPPVLTGTNSHVITHQGYQFSSGATTDMHTALRRTADTGDRLRIRNDGSMIAGDGVSTLWKFLYGNALGWRTDGKLIADLGLGVGNSAAATTAVGSLAKKIEVFDNAGVSLGFIPVYATIT